MKSKKAQPMLSLALVLGIAAAAVCLPLLTVWRQVSITGSAREMNALRDSLTVLKKEAVTLQLSVEQLSQSERIEQIARESLELEYPESRRIVIVPSPGCKLEKAVGNLKLFSVLKESLPKG